ncbi:class I SAM-dependent methyltransferase [Caloramator sp. E03]|uniref:class I SAM-dependent DNA methyltransferase n=1 Tax=Caloramator sp. E03 TaxID=2576307 RepID=UPI001110439D|nr:class I SAM-dependent methyltransferase [Caloramator sp. E03]QCX32947.1 class I SAM-dependent methyltransferase [Caloramator sp. E03]
MEQYTALSKIYDDMIDIDYDKWMRFVENYFSWSLKNKNILELACGTGNMTLRLKEKGCNITAFDISEDMLSIAEEKARINRQKINFLKQDIRSFNIDKKFDYIFCFCDGYNYVIEDDDIIKSFNNVYKHLMPNGYFLFDISTSYKLKNIIANNTFTLNEEKLCYIWDNYLDGDILEMYITFFIKEGALYKRFDERHIQKAYEVDKIMHYLSIIGFKDIKIFDDYTLSDIKNDSLRAVIIAKKEE